MSSHVHPNLGESWVVRMRKHHLLVGTYLGTEIIARRIPLQLPRRNPLSIRESLHCLLVVLRFKTIKILKYLGYN